MGVGSNRAGKQCRERWLNHLDDSISKDPWSTEEDLTLLTKQKIIGNKWSEIVKYLPGRTENMVKNRFNTLAKQKREEKRNISTKPLEEVIISLEESKERKDLVNWVDEKIEELQSLIGKEESNSKNDLEIKYAAMSLQDRRKRKYEEKKEYYENCKMEVDREDSNFEKSHKSGQLIPKEPNVNLNHTFNSVNFECKQNIFDMKEDSAMLCDSTPQQYFNKRTPIDGQLGVFASPLEIPKRSLQQRETRLNNSFSVLKPMPSPSVPKVIEQSKVYEKNSSIQNDDALMNLLKICDSKESKANQLKLIKQLLCDFRDSDDVQKDKTLNTIDNMILGFDCDSNLNLIQQSKLETKMSSSNSSVVSFDSKQNFKKESDHKQVKTAFGANKSSRVKNTLFGIHKEEANNITKVSKSPEPCPPKAPKVETFQSPIVTSAFENDKKMMSGFTRMGGNMQPNGTPCMITPLCESTPRMLDQMPTSMYGGMSCFDQNNQMRDCLIQSPSPNFRMGARFNPETPQQNVFHTRTNTWQKDSMSLFYPNSPLLSFNGRNNMVQRMNPMDNPNSIFRNKWNE